MLEQIGIKRPHSHMSEFVRQVTYQGVTHKPDTPPLEMQGVTVAYAAGVNDITAIRGSPRVLEDISFRVSHGERVAVVGPNGAGKSTLFKLIVGTLKPSQGKVHTYGHVPDSHICIAYVPQHSQVDWSFPVTVEDVVMMGRIGKIGLFRWPRRRDREVVRACLERVKVDHLARKQIGELSGGQQQRVFIARALAQSAELMLLDEPLAGLDIPGQKAIFEILDSLRPDGVTVLLATHDLNVAAEKFDQVMLLNKRIIAFGPAEAVLTTDHLMSAYGGLMHRLDEDGAVLLADPTHDHSEEL